MMALLIPVKDKCFVVNFGFCFVFWSGWLRPFHFIIFIINWCKKFESRTYSGIFKSQLVSLKSQSGLKMNV